MKPIRYIVDKVDGEPFKLLNPSLLKSELDSLPKGRYELIIRKMYRKATPKQFGYLYSIVYPMFLLAAWENGYTTDDFKNVDELDIWCKAQWANTPLLNRETGETIITPLSKSKFVTIDEMTYCNKLRDHASEYWGVYIPEPDPNWMTKK